MPRLIEGPGGGRPGREEAAADGKGAESAAAAPEGEAEAAEEAEAGRRPRQSKMTRGRRGGWRWCRSQWRGRGETGQGGRKPRPMEEEPWMPPWPPKKKPSPPKGGEATAVVGGECRGRGMGDAAVMGDVAVRGWEGVGSAF